MHTGHRSQASTEVWNYRHGSTSLCIFCFRPPWWMFWIFWIELDVSYQMVLPKIATMVNSYAAWPPHSSVYWRRCYGISQYMMRILNSQMIMWLVPSSHNHIHSWLLRSLNEQNANLLRGKIVRSFVIYLLLDTSLQTTGQKSKCWNAKHSLYFENEL